MNAELHRPLQDAIDRLDCVQGLQPSGGGYRTRLEHKTPTGKPVQGQRLRLWGSMLLSSPNPFLLLGLPLAGHTVSC